MKKQPIETAFGVHAGSLRAKLLSRLKRSAGKRVKFRDLSKLVGGPQRTASALRVLTNQGLRRKAPMKIVKEGIGQDADVMLVRASKARQ